MGDFAFFLRKTSEYSRKHYALHFTISYFLAYYFTTLIGHISVCIFFVPFFHFPFLLTNVKFEEHLIMMIIETILFSSLISSKIPFSDAVFMTLINMFIVQHRDSDKGLSVLYFLMEIVYVSVFKSIEVVALVLFLCSVFSLFFEDVIVKLPVLFDTFPAKETIIAFIFDAMIGNKIKKEGFFITLFLYFLRIPKIFYQINITLENVYSMFYIFINFYVNIYGLFTGFRNGSSSLVSSSILSLYNAFSLTIVLISKMISSLPANKEFSYGFNVIKCIFHFVNSLIIFASIYAHIIDTCCTSIDSNIVRCKYPWHTVFISTADFILTTIGATAIGNFKITSFTMICDIFTSIAALVSSLFDSVFDIIEFDSIISVIVCLVLLLTLKDEVKSALNHLNLRSSKRFKDHALKSIGLSNSNVEYHFWNDGSMTNVLTIKSAKREDKDEILKRASKFACICKAVDITIEI